MIRKFRRQLTEAEVKYGFIYIDDDKFRQAITGKNKLIIKTPSGLYSLRLDMRKRLGWSRSMFKDNNLHPRDAISLSKTNNTIVVSKNK